MITVYDEHGNAILELTEQQYSRRVERLFVNVRKRLQRLEQRREELGEYKKRADKALFNSQGADRRIFVLFQRVKELEEELERIKNHE